VKTVMEIVKQPAMTMRVAHWIHQKTAIVCMKPSQNSKMVMGVVPPAQPMPPILIVKQLVAMEPRILARTAMVTALQSVMIRIPAPLTHPITVNANTRPLRLPIRMTDAVLHPKIRPRIRLALQNVEMALLNPVKIATEPHWVPRAKSSVTTVER